MELFGPSMICKFVYDLLLCLFILNLDLETAKSRSSSRNWGN